MNKVEKFSTQIKAIKITATKILDMKNKTGESSREIQHQTSWSKQKKVSQLKDRSFEIIQSEKEKKKRVGWRKSALWDLWYIVNYFFFLPGMVIFLK